MSRPLSRTVVLFYALSAVGSACAYEANDRWTNTATDGSTGSQGTPITLTWGFVADGTPITGGFGEPTSNSNLISFLDTEIGVGAWFSIFTDSYDRLSELSGLTFVNEPNDTGQAINGTASPFGSLGVRPDLRIGGHSIDGQAGSNTLAYNYTPDHGDMVLDTDNSSFFSNPSNNFLGFRNTLMHEVGHGLGLSHVESNNAGILLEPFITTGFDGPQLDDILGLQRNYGDVWEKAGGNNAFGSATTLGSLSAGGTSTIGTEGGSTAVLPSQTDFISIDDDSDVDFFSFTLTEELAVSLDLTPQGTTYNVGPEGGTQISLNSQSLSDLTLQLLDANGTTVLDTANGTGAGSAETIASTLSAGTYYARVSGAANDVQLYELSISANNVTSELVWHGDDATNPTYWDRNLTPNYDEGGLASVFQDTDNVTFDDSASTFTVDIQENVSPGSVSFENNLNDYLLSGAGIVGLTGVTKSGAATVMFQNSGNTYLGLTDVQAGKLVLLGNHSGIAGDITIAVGAEVEVGSNGTTLGKLPSTNITVDGELHIQTYLGDLNASLLGGGIVRSSSDLLTFNGDNSSFAGTFEIDMGEVSVGSNGGNSYPAAATINLNGGVMNVAADGLVRTVSSEININSGSAPQIQVAGTVGSELVLEGTVTVNNLGSQVHSTADAILTINGAIQLATGINLELSAAGTGGNAMRLNGGIAGPAAIEKIDVGEVILSGANAHTGNTTIKAGTLTLASTGTLASTPVIDVQTSATLDVSGLGSGYSLAGSTAQTLLIDGHVLGDVIALTDSLVTGEGSMTGNLMAEAGSLIDVGGPSITNPLSIVDLAINGNYSQAVDARLAIDLFDASLFDQLAITGDATLSGGTLDVKLAEGFIPMPGDTFNILTAGSVAGAFDTLSLPSLPGDLLWFVNYGTTSVELISTFGADFDEDGDVDSFDLSAWEGGFGSVPTDHMGGDANADALANGFDFLTWQRQYGDDRAPLAALGKIPEPATWCLLLMGLAAVLMTKRPGKFSA